MRRWRGEGLAFLAEARNRRFATLDLAHPEGQALLRALAARADVLIDGFPAGQMDTWGIGYRQLQPLAPRLVYVALSTHGQFGPRAAQAGPEYDLIDQALSGLAFLTGEPGDDRPEARPTRVGSWISAYAQAAWAGMAALAALHWRDRPGGTGQMIDVSGAEALMRYLEYTLLLYHTHRDIRQRMGIFDLAVSVYTFVPVKDGWAFIAGYTDPNFGAICRVMGRPELTQDPRFRTTLDRTRPENRAALREEIARWSVNYTASEILARVLADPGPGVVVFGPVNRPTRTLAEPHWWARGCFGRLDGPDLRAAAARAAGLADDPDAAAARDPRAPRRPRQHRRLRPLLRLRRQPAGRAEVTRYHLIREAHHRCSIRRLTRSRSRSSPRSGSGTSSAARRRWS